MTEIEKMFENAGIRICKRKQGFTLKDCTDRECKECGYYALPPFTAEKQLELIKWLIDEVDYITMWHFNNSKKPYDFDLGNLNSGGETFEDALAQMINDLWQDLADQEKEKIRGILNENND